MSLPTQRLEVTRGLELIAQGSTLRAAAIAVGGSLNDEEFEGAK